LRVIFDGFIRDCRQIDARSARQRRTGAEPEALRLAGLP